MFNKLVKGFVVGVALIGSLTMVGCVSSMDEEFTERNLEVIESYKPLGHEDYEYYIHTAKSKDEIDDGLIEEMAKSRYLSGDLQNGIDTDEAIIGYSLGLLEKLDPDKNFEYRAKSISDEVMVWVNEVRQADKEANKLSDDEIVELMEVEIYNRFGIVNASLFKLVYYLETESEDFAVGEVTSVQTGKKVMEIKVNKYTGDVFSSEL